MVLLDAVTGLRRSDLMALKWLDVDFEQLEISVTRSIYRQVVDRCKTEPIFASSSVKSRPSMGCTPSS